LLDAKNVGISISGLAFNPSTHHLFALTNDDAGFDVYVLDVNADYAILGGFDIAGLGDFEQAGLGIDCDGNLWIANQENNTVIQTTSGESGICSWSAIPWLDATPRSGTLPLDKGQEITLNLDATGLSAGLHQAQLRISNDTPEGPLYIPINLTVIQTDYYFSVTPITATRLGDPGEVVTYTIEISNLGKLTDFYAITISNNEWLTSAPFLISPVFSGGKTQFVATVYIPGNTSASLSDTALLTIQSHGDFDKTIDVALTTTASRVQYEIYLPYISRE
jgi:hypothetical protein